MIIKSYDKINQLVIKSENLRKRYSEDLHLAMSDKDELLNKVFEKEQNKKLTDISYEII